MINLALSHSILLRQMVLSELSISGIDNNRNLQIEILSAKEFIDGSYTTDFIEEFEKRRKK